MGKKRLFGIFLILILAIFLISSAFAFSFSDITNFFNNLFSKPQLSPTNLVAYYPFDGNATDASGYGNPLNGVVNGATLATGKFGNSYLFDGVNDYISVPFNTRLNYRTSDTGITVSAWVKIGETGRDTKVVAFQN